ncbi:TPA: YqaE/Pmp3 family membrane protein [Candidatus Collierbacteria bacterium]|nr:YqaE/Pmp3 family membrane protein [Candidatus Collierbacteria bacterium]
MGDISLRLSHLSGNDVAFIILAIILPPIAVLLKVGLTTQFWINVILTILGVIPGQIHAMWIVLF